MTNRNYFKALAFVAFVILCTYLYYRVFPSPIVASTETTTKLDGKTVHMKTVEYTDRVCTLAKINGGVSDSIAISCYPRVQAAR